MNGIIAMIALWFIFQAVSGQKKKKARQEELPAQGDIPFPSGIRIPSLETQMPETAMEQPEAVEPPWETPAPARSPRKRSSHLVRQEQPLLQQVAQGLQSSQNALSAVVYAEILGKPKALRRYRRF